MRSNLAAFSAAAILTCAATVDAAIVITSGPVPPADIGARIRWGGNGSEAALVDFIDGTPNADLNPNLNPGGNPIWNTADDLAYDFQVTFNPATGALGLSVDFDRNGSFTTGSEAVSRTDFIDPPQTSYEGFGFSHLTIGSNETGTSGRSRIDNLVINGTPFGSLVPNGQNLLTRFEDSSGNLLGLVTITGEVTFTEPGTAANQPAWNFAFRGPAPIPEPTTILAGVLLLLPFGASALRMLRKK